MILDCCGLLRKNTEPVNFLCQLLAITKMPKTDSSSTHSQDKTRLMLALWALGADKTQVKKGELTEKVKRTKQTAQYYEGIVEALSQEGAIAITTIRKRNKTISLTEQGLQMLGEALNSSDFEFESQIGAKMANALLRWMRERGGSKEGAIAPVNKIASYDEFKSLALEVYDKLNQNYNLDNLVPIYQLRREIKEHVSRSQFNDWLLEMQANDLIQLIGGEMPDLTPDKAEDSISTKLGGVRYYIKRLKSEK
jgi:predicted transcriptional regulator